MARTAGLVAYLEDKGFEVQVAPVKGGKRLELSKGKWWAKLDVHKDHVNWVSLKGPWLKQAHDIVRDTFKDLGIDFLIADPLNARAEAKLKSYGDWKPTTVNGKSRLRWEL